MTVCRLLCAFCLTGLCVVGVAHAQDEPTPAPPAQDAAALQAELDRLYKQVLPRLEARERELRERLAQDQAVQAGYKRATEARAAQHEALKASEDLAAARQAEQAAAEKYQTAVNTAMGLDGEAATLRDRRSQIDRELFALELERKLIESRLEHHRRAIERSPSPQLKQKRTQYHEASRAASDTWNTDEELVAARRAFEEAKQAYNKAVAQLPEKAAMDQAYAALKQAERGEAIASANQRKDETRKAYADALAEEVKSDPEAFAVQQSLEQARARYDTLRGERDKVESAMRDQRRSIERGDDPAVAAARDAYNEARNQTRQITDAVVKADRDTEHAARHAAEALRELAAADPQGQALAKQRKALDDQIRDLKHRIKLAEKAAKRDNADAAKPTE